MIQHRKTKLYLLCIALLPLLIILLAGWWFRFPLSFTQVPSSATTTHLVGVDATNNEVVENSEQLNVYRNDEFGFSFRFPKEWDTRIPEFGSSVSLFNMGLKPIDYGGLGYVVINVTQKNWIESALVKMRARGVTTTDIVVSGRPALRLEDKDRISRPSTSVLILVDDKFWIDITGVKGNEEVYNMVLDSFVIE